MYALFTLFSLGILAAFIPEYVLYIHTFYLYRMHYFEKNNHGEIKANLRERVVRPFLLLCIHKKKLR